MAKHPSVAEFESWVTETFGRDGRFDRLETRARPEAGTADMEFRLHVGKKSYYDLRVDLEGGQLQAGFATENRVINEAIEQLVLDNGGDLSDLLSDELCDLGEEPLSMEHFFERPCFRFVVRLPLGTPDALTESVLRDRAKNVIAASRVLFQDCVDEA